MLQHWVSEGKFYIGGFVLLTFIEPVRLLLNELVDIQNRLCRTSLRSLNAVAFSSIRQCEYHVGGMVRRWEVF